MATAKDAGTTKAPEEEYPAHAHFPRVKADYPMLTKVLTFWSGVGQGFLVLYGLTQLYPRASWGLLSAAFLMLTLR
jgi:hypothetical protein